MFFPVELWAWTLCAEVVLAIQHLLGCCILGETSQRRSASVTKFSQPRAWISLRRANAAPQSKLCCVIPFFILIIFRSIIQFLVVLFPLLLWLHQHIVCDATTINGWDWKLKKKKSNFQSELLNKKILKRSKIKVKNVKKIYKGKWVIAWCNCF